MATATADIWVLPELFNSGYLFRTIDEVRQLAEDVPGGYTTQALLELAERYDTTIIAGIAEKDGEHFYNAAICVDGSDGLLGCYRKIHLFDREKLFFTPGDTPFDVIELAGCKIGMMICFDWIFPEAARSLALKGADLICHPSNLVLPYCQNAMVTRCLENRVFAVTANRIGTESRGEHTLGFTGGSQIVSPKGVILAKASTNTEAVQVVDIDISEAQDKMVTANNQLFEDRRSDFYSL